MDYIKRYNDAREMKEDPDFAPLLPLWNALAEYFRENFKLSPEEADDCVGDYITLGRNVIPRLVMRSGRGSYHMDAFGDERIMKFYGALWESIASRKRECDNEEAGMLDNKLRELNDPEGFINNFFPEYAKSPNFRHPA
jgi:hypothetical protein